MKLANKILFKSPFSWKVNRLTFCALNMATGSLNTMLLSTSLGWLLGIIVKKLSRMPFELKEIQFVLSASLQVGLLSLLLFNMFMNIKWINNGKRSREYFKFYITLSILLNFYALAYAVLSHPIFIAPCFLNLGLHLLQGWGIDNNKTTPKEIGELKNDQPPPHTNQEVAETD